MTLAKFIKNSVGGGVALISLSLLAPTSAFAGTIIRPTTVTSPGGENFLAPLVNMINQSGLSPTYTSGVTDFDTYTATATHTFGGTLNSNFGQSNQAIVNSPILFTFDLGSVVPIDALAYWISDTSSQGTPDQDVQNFQLFAGSDDMGTLLGTYSATQGNFNGVSNAQVFTFAATSTQFITLKATSVFLPPDGGGNPIIGEVAFRETQQEPPATTPEPGTILGLVTVGALGALSRKRKLNQKSK